MVELKQVLNKIVLKSNRLNDLEEARLRYLDLRKKYLVFSKKLGYETTSTLQELLEKRDYVVVEKILIQKHNLEYNYNMVNLKLFRKVVKLSKAIERDVLKDKIHKPNKTIMIL